MKINNKKYKLHLLISIIVFIFIIHLTIPFSIYKIYWPLYILRVVLLLDIIYIIISASLVYVNREIKEQKKSKKVKETIKKEKYEKNITEDEDQLYEEIDEKLDNISKQYDDNLKKEEQLKDLIVVNHMIENDNE